MPPLGAAVLVHGVRVGTLWHLDDDDNHEFQFDEDWLADPERPVLGQLFEDRRPRPIVTSGLPSWFAHLLPQGPWARALHRWAGLEEDCPDLELLLHVAGDLPGALDLVRLQGGLFEPTRLVPAPEVAPGRIRFTLAGNQWKLSVRRGERGLVVPVVGEDGEFVAKFHDPVHPGLPQIENTTLRWAKQSGLDVPPARLATIDEFVDLPEEIPVGDRLALLVRRFDRSHGVRIHWEELAQVVDRPRGDVVGGQYHGAYEEIAALVGELTPQDVGAFLDRLIFAVCSGDGDAHWKNWGFIYPDRRNPRLAPAYDLVPTILYPRLDPELALSLGGVRRFDSVSRTALFNLSSLLGWPEEAVARHFEDAMSRIDAAFRDVSESFTTEQRAVLLRHLESAWSR